jgi:DNA-binding response OmpR family regulator
MDGWRFREEMRQIDGASDIPVVVLSAIHSIVDAAKQIQADGYIAKPFDIDQLLARLADYAGQAHRQGKI